LLLLELLLRLRSSLAAGSSATVAAAVGVAGFVVVAAAAVGTRVGVLGRCSSWGCPSEVLSFVSGSFDFFDPNPHCSKISSS
jgi:hypothetical protein